MSRSRTSTLLNAFIGAIVGVIVSFIPFSTLFGGALAGFLEGERPRDGTIAGAIAGIIMFLPVWGLFAVFLGFFGSAFGLGFGPPAESLLAIAFVIALVAIAVAVYTVGLAALGGFLGSILAAEYPDQRYRLRDTLGMKHGDRRPSREPPLEEP